MAMAKTQPIMVLLAMAAWAAVAGLQEASAEAVCASASGCAELSHGPRNPAVSIGNGYVQVPKGESYCPGWWDCKGSAWEKYFAESMQLVVMGTCLAILLWQAINFRVVGKRAVAWEVVYVMGIVFTFYVVVVPLGSPVMPFMSTGKYIVMLRYGQWLFATPVLLFSVADMTGQRGTYTHEHMAMVVADVFAIAVFVLGCVSPLYGVMVLCYYLSWAGFILTFWIAWKCLRQLHDEVPSAEMQMTVKAIIVTFFVGWNMHTVVSTIGPECLNWINVHQTEIGACFSDMVAKCTFCVLVTVLRIQVVEHERRKLQRQYSPELAATRASSSSPEASPSSPQLSSSNGPAQGATQADATSSPSPAAVQFADVKPHLRTLGLLVAGTLGAMHLCTFVLAMVSRRTTPDRCASSAPYHSFAPLNISFQALAAQASPHLLLPARRGPQDPSVDLGNGWVQLPENQCYCKRWYTEVAAATPSERSTVDVLQWSLLALCCTILLWMFYLHQVMQPEVVAWELVYVLSVVFSFYTVEFTQQLDTPVMIFLSNGRSVVLMRYAQWLMCTPALVVNMADLLGRTGFSLEHCFLVVADVAAVNIYIFGSLTSSATVAAVCYALSTSGFLYIFWVAWKCLIRLHNEVPSGPARRTVKLLIAVVFIGWNMHTVVSTIGPEYLGWINVHETEIGACFSDLVAKCTYVVLATVLRIQVLKLEAKSSEAGEASAEGTATSAGALEGAGPISGKDKEERELMSLNSLLFLSFLIHAAFFVIAMPLLWAANSKLDL